MWAALRSRWWAGWARFFPEDATSLGAVGHAERLRGQSGPVGDDEHAFHDASLRELRAIDPNTLAPDEALEHESMLRASAFRTHVLERDQDRRCLELSLHAQGMIGHRRAHTDDAEELRARLDAVPGVLAGREIALREGLARGHAPDRDVLDVVVGYALPGAERWYRGLSHPSAARAADATAAHRAFLERELAPRSEIGAARLGEEELTTRFALTYGESIDPRVVRASAREAITLLSARLVLSAAHAARARGIFVRHLADAHAYVALLFREAIEGDPRPHYAALLAHATDFAAERRLFTPPARPPDFVAIPDGMIHGGAITNWPAPLLDRSRNGHIALSLAPGAHSIAFATGLAIHEGTPGHYLQSAVWQRSASAGHEPVRFVAVHDDVAMASSFFGAMPSVEGFAVHAENVMFEAGFYDRDAEVAALASAIIRAARAAVDVSLHLREATPEEASQELHRATGMPLSWCAMQITRFLRIPVQASTYFVGAKRHATMLDAARIRRGVGFVADAFHDALLALGPASLRTLAQRLDQG